MKHFGEEWNRDVGAIFAEAGGLGDDVGMDLNDADDLGTPVLAPNNAQISTDAMRDDLRRYGLQSFDQTRATGALRQFAEDSGASVNTTMLFTILGLGLLGLLLFLNTSSGGVGDIEPSQEPKKRSARWYWKKTRHPQTRRRSRAIRRRRARKSKDVSGFGLAPRRGKQLRIRSMKKILKSKHPADHLTASQRRDYVNEIRRRRRRTRKS